MSAALTNFKTEIIITPTQNQRDAAIWFFYIGARAKFIHEHPQLYQGQSGLVVPTFDEEMAGRWMLVHSCENELQQGKAVPSAYLADLLRVHQAGYLSEYVWWFLNQPSWRGDQQPANLLAFIVWANANLNGHAVETYGGIRIVPDGSEIGTSREGAAGRVGNLPPVDIRNGGGQELRSQVDAIAARLHQGNFREAGQLLDAFVRAVRDLQREAGAMYGCFRSQRELNFFQAKRPDVCVLRVLDWCVAEGMYLRVFLHSHLQRHAEALSCLEDVVKIAPLFGRIHGEQGYILNRLRRPQEAAAAYARAWDLSARLPENVAAAAPALRGLAVACVDLGDLDRAEKLLRDSLVIEPANQIAASELEYITQRRRAGGSSVR